jgi:hypothetical protein
MADDANLKQSIERKTAETVDAVTPNHVEQDHLPDERERRLQQQAETQASWASPGLAALSPGQATGMIMGLVGGGLIGAVVFMWVGLIPMAGLAVGWRLAICAAIGALAGGTAGTLYWGGRAPELSGEMVDDDGDDA